MTILCEIFDKVPTIEGKLIIAFGIALACASLVHFKREVAWPLLMLTLLTGGLLACDAIDDAFVSGSFRDVLWIDLGWPWVLVTIVAPLIPPLCVAAVMFLDIPRILRSA